MQTKKKLSRCVNRVNLKQSYLPSLVYFFIGRRAFREYAGQLFFDPSLARGRKSNVDAVLIARNGATRHVRDKTSRGESQITLDVDQGLRVFEKLMSDGVGLAIRLRQPNPAKIQMVMLQSCLRYGAPSRTAIRILSF